MVSRFSHATADVWSRPDALQVVFSVAAATNDAAIKAADVPAPPEAGLQNADSAIWFGVFMPVKTPRDIVEKFHAAGMKVLNEPAMQDSLKKLGVETSALRPEEMDALVVCA